MSIQIITQTVQHLYGNKKELNNGNANDSSSFKYMSNLLKGLTTRDIGANVNPDIANAHRLLFSVQIVVSLKYVSSFFRYLEMPLINCKIHLELN